MPDLLTLTTPDWTLQVWSRDVETPRRQLQQTLAVRGGKQLPPSRIRLAPAEGADANGQLFVSGEASLPEPIFFENRQYDFEFEFVEGVTGQQVHHRLRVVEDCFHQRGRLLRGNINAGNDIGWFRLALSYRRVGKPVEQNLSFEVLPTKMDMENDLQNILQVVDKEYPLWRFSLAQKTELELAQTRKPHEQFPLLWLAHFKALRGELENSIKQVINAPHSRLLPVTRSLRVDRLKGRINHRLEERGTENLKAGEFHHRYKVTVRKLSIDTPENRFVKMVLERCVHMLARIERLAMDNNKTPDQQPLSKSFFDELKRWAQPLEQYLARPFFREVGDFNGMSRESLVLHQKAGYSGVYRIWQQLKLYLDTLGAASSISMKTVADLYEVWCLLEILRMLIELGFEEKNSKKAQLSDKALVKTLKNGIGAAFTLVRGEVEIKLSHEPAFSSPDQSRKHGIYSWVTSQKPDILLEAIFANGTVIRWIFDAKYRIAPEQNTQGDEKVDYAPDDAINQMHRYRDALIHLDKSDAAPQQKSRPILGAYVLYPGYFDENGKDNIYSRAIDEIGIGAFPLLPGRPNSWLKQFLEEKFAKTPPEHPYELSNPERFFVEDAARIPSHGMSVSHHPDLVLVFTGPVRNRSDAYKAAQRNGSLRWYHTRVHATDRQDIQAHVIREARMLAIPEDYTADQQTVRHFYPVKSIQMVKRSVINEEMSGIPISENPDEPYWLFELGSSVVLPQSLEHDSTDHFEVFVTDFSGMTSGGLCKDLPRYYKNLY